MSGIAWLPPSPRCYFFGCWNEPGHYLRAASTNPKESANTRHAQEYFGSDHAHLDANLAPRRHRRTGRIVWVGSGVSKQERQRIGYDSEELPMGQFLLHHLDTGFTAIQWWDRTQGDVRGACNSTVLLEGRHSAAEMLAALEEHFPSVLENLTKAGVRLIEVHLERGEADGK